MNLVERTIRVPAASPTPAVIEIVILEPRPGRFRAWFARAFFRLGGWCARARVRYAQS